MVLQPVKQWCLAPSAVCAFFHLNNSKSALNLVVVAVARQAQQQAVHASAGSTGVQRHLLGCANSVCALACSGNTIVSAEAGKLGLIRLWDAPTGQCQALLHGVYLTHAALHQLCHQLDGTNPVLTDWPHKHWQVHTGPLSFVTTRTRVTCLSTHAYHNN